MTGAGAAGAGPRSARGAGGPPGRFSPVARGRRAASRAGPAPEEAQHPPGEALHPPGERAAALLGDDGPPSGEVAGPGGGLGEDGTGLAEPVEPGTGSSRVAAAGVLPRAAAVASARAAVRRGRERRAATRGTYAAWEAHTVREARRSPYGGLVEESTDAAPTAAADAPAGASTGGAVRDHESPGRESGPLAAGQRTRLALWERLPLWVQLRCGIEPKTLLALAVVLVVAVGFAVHHFWTGRPEAVRAPAVEPAAEGTGGEPGAAGRTAGAGRGSAQLSGRRLMVDVGGKVRKPGVYKLADGARVADALKAAGGVRPGTDVSGLNRARRIVDGEQIVAGGPPGARAGSAARGGAKGGGAGADSGGGAAAAGAAGGGTAQGGPVSLSSATAAQLETLPGVGPVLAQHIVEYREEHGGFTSVSQLKEVDGIGDSRFADIEPKVSP